MPRLVRLAHPLCAPICTPACTVIRTAAPAALLMLLCLSMSGCVTGPTFIAPNARRPIDRAVVDYPGDCALEVVAQNLTGAIDCDVDAQGILIVAESGAGGYEPHIFGCRTDGSTFDIYPPF